jgi:hypothetical protein
MNKNQRYMPVHRRKPYPITGFPVSIKNRLKRMKITGDVYTTKEKGAHGGNPERPKN